MSPSKPPQSRATQRPTAPPPEVVDPRWLLKAAGAVAAFGLLCAYITLCLFFYFGQWQFVLHPSHAVAQTPAALQMPFEKVRFGDDRSSQPQLTGFWIPGTNRSNPIVLMLHSQNGSVSDALPAAKALHDADLQALLFDYRGYGHSMGQHPTEASMRQDAESAFQYLLAHDGAAAGRIFLYGKDLGASLAVGLANKHPQIRGIILDSADGDTLSRVQADQRSRIIPVRLLFHERFPLADPLHVLQAPKLLLSHTSGPPPEIAQRAADPKMTVEIPGNGSGKAVTEAIRRFIDTYAPTAAGS